MTEPSDRRSRRAWPLRTEPTTTPAGTHDHGVSNTPMGMAFLGIALLLVVNIALVGYVFIARETRDEQNRQTNQRINDAMCDLLDQLPEGGLLERPRSKYGCGPGIPLSELPPEQQERLRAQRYVPAPSSQSVAPAPSSAPTPLADGANPSGPVLTPDEAAPATPPSTASEPPPLVDLGPYTGPVCESVRVCF